MVPDIAFFRQGNISDNYEYVTKGHHSTEIILPPDVLFKNIVFSISVSKSETFQRKISPTEDTLLVDLKILYFPAHVVFHYPYPNQPPENL